MRAPSAGFLFVALLVVGCNNGQESREAAAIARLRGHKAPGYLRVVNLTEAPLAIMDRGRPVVGVVPGGQASMLRPLAVENKLTIAGNPTPVSIMSGQGTSVLVFGSAKNEQIGGEVVRPDGKANVRIVFAKGDGSVSAAKSYPIRGDASSTISSETTKISLGPGRYTIDGQSIPIEKNCVYTFFFVPQDGRVRLFLLKNTDNAAPVSGGTSKV